jgi:hypothetical protein
MITDKRANKIDIHITALDNDATKIGSQAKMSD